MKGVKGDDLGRLRAPPEGALEASLAIDAPGGTLQSTPNAIAQDALDHASFLYDKLAILVRTDACSPSRFEISKRANGVEVHFWHDELAPV